MGTLIQDLRFGYRMLVKDPAFTCIVVLTLALGIGANSTIFSWINSTLLTPIPAVGRAGNLVVFVRGDGGSNATPPLSWKRIRRNSQVAAYGSTGGGADLSFNVVADLRGAFRAQFPELAEM